MYENFEIIFKRLLTWDLGVVGLIHRNGRQQTGDTGMFTYNEAYKFGAEFTAKNVGYSFGIREVGEKANRRFYIELYDQKAGEIFCSIIDYTK